MPASQRRRRASRHKAKKPIEVVDPDAAYKASLDSSHYIAQAQRAKLDETYLTRIRDAITTFTSAAVGAQSKEGTAAAAETSGAVPMRSVDAIVRALGLCPSDEQLRQIHALVQPHAPDTSAHGHAAEAAAATGEAATTPKKRRGGEGSEACADRGRLERLLVQLLRTRVLTYNPYSVDNPPQSVAAARCLASVVYMAEDKLAQDLFEALWKACGSRYTQSTSEPTARCIAADDLRALMRSRAKQRTPNDESFSEADMEEMYFTIAEAASDVLREDTFIHTMSNVK